MWASVERMSVAIWQDRLAVLRAGIGGVSVRNCAEAGERVDGAWA
jgi:hypothetical protein